MGMGVTEKGYVYGIEPAGTCRLMSDEVQKMASYRREDYLLKVMEVEGRLTKMDKFITLDLSDSNQREHSTTFLKKEILFD